MIPASSIPGRRTISRASAAASSGVRTGDRLAPTRTPPTGSANARSSSITTRAGGLSRSSCSTESTTSAGWRSAGNDDKAAIALRSTVGYARSRSSKPCSVSHSVSGSVNVISPRNPGSRSRIARWSGRQRTDFDATRIGFPPAARSRSPALAHIASRSTNANGASRPANASSYTSYRPRKLWTGVDAGDAAMAMRGLSCRAMRRLSPFVLALALVGCLLPSAASGATPRIKHVWIVVLENKDYEDSFGPDTEAPYMARELTKSGQLLENYFGTSHASLGNYITMVSGMAPNADTQGDCMAGFKDIFPG